MRLRYIVSVIIEKKPVVAYIPVGAKQLPPGTALATIHDVQPGGAVRRVRVGKAGTGYQGTGG